MNGRKHSPKPLKVSPDSKYYFIDQVKVVTEMIQKILHRRGYNIIPYTEESIRLFSQDPEEKQRTVFEKHKNYLNLAQQKFILDGTGKLSAEDEKGCLGVFLKNYNILVPVEVFDEIKKGNIIEVYTEEHVQIYSNFSFLDECAYDYLTTTREPWYALYERGEIISKLIFDKAESFLLSSKVYSSIDPEIPEHTVKELKINDLKRKFLIKMKRWIKVPYVKEGTCFIDKRINLAL